MTQNAQFPTIWKEAFDAYEKFTNRKLQDQPILAKVQTTEGLLKQLESRDRTFSKWRNQHSRAWNFLSNCMKPVETLGDIVSSALSFTPFAPASTVLGAAFFLIQSCDNVTNAYNHIEELFATLEDFTNRLAEYTRGKIGQQLQKSVVAILTCLLQIIGRAEKTIKRGRIKEYFAATFFGKDEKVQALVDRLNKLLDTEERLVISILYSSTQRIESKLDAQSIAQSTKDEEDLLRKVLGEAVWSRTEELYQRNKHDLVKKSGEWLRLEPLFQKWIDRTIPLLFIVGGPGTGKSFLSTWTIANLQELHRQDTDHPSQVSVGYFYIRNVEQQLHDMKAMLKSIAFQLAFVNKTYRNYAVNACKSSRNVSSLEGIWKSLFIDFYTTSQYSDHSAFIVIDGLDEAPEDVRAFVDLLETLVTPKLLSVPSRLRFIVFGRPEILDYIEEPRNIRSVEVGLKNHDDIDRYIRKRLLKLYVGKLERRTGSKSRAEKRERQIREKILDKAKGSFLWVKLVMDQICEQPRWSDVDAALDHVPQGIDKMIHHVFERLDANESVSKKDLNAMLVWVTLAKRPLLMGEINTILSLPPHKGHYMGLNEHLKTRFASLFKLSRREIADRFDDDNDEGIANLDVTIDEKASAATVEKDRSSNHPDEGQSSEDEEFGDTNSSQVDSDEDDDSSEVDEKTMEIFKSTRVEFSHLRIKELLLQESRLETRTWPESLGIGLNINEAELQIAMTCLRVLCDGNTQDDSLDLYDSRDLYKYQGLHEYSRQHLFEHLKAVKEDKLTKHSKEVVHYMFRLFSEKTVLESLLKSIFFLDEEPQEDFLRVWLIDGGIHQFMPEFFSKIDEDDDSVNLELRIWLQESISSSKKAFYPLACVASKIWFAEPTFHTVADNVWLWIRMTVFMIQILYRYSDLDKPRAMSTAESAYDTASGKSQVLDNFRPLSGISADTLISLAAVIEVEETIYWHANLGWALSLAGHHDEAEKYLLRAIAMDDTAWWPIYGVACNLSSSKSYSQAADWGLKTMGALSDAMRESHDATHIRLQINAWLRDSGNSERAIRVAHETYSSRPKDLDTIDPYIRALHLGGRTEETFPIFKTLSGIGTTSGEGTLLADMLLNGSRGSQAVIPFAVRSSECGQEIKDAFDPLQLGDRVDPRKLDRVAAFKYRYLDQTEEAIEAWINVLEKAQEPNQRTSALTKLPQILFDLAASAKKTGDDYESWVSKLQGLSDIWGKCGSDRDNSYSTLLLGHWYRQFEQAEEKVWRPYFKARILEALEMLNDDDLSNDQDAYYRLARILFLAGDRENATAAYAVALKPLEALATQKKAAVRNYFMWYSWSSCSGICNTAKLELKELHTCETCFEVLFCESCIKLVKANELPVRVCSSQHPFSLVYPLPEERQNFAARLIDGRVEVQKEWVERLRKQWKKW